MSKLPKSFYSWTTMIGALLASVSFFLIIFLILISLIFPGEQTHYLGLFTYIIVPVFLVIGLVLIPIGTIKKFKRDKKDLVKKEVKYPRIDLNDPKQSRAVIIFVLGSAFFILFTAIGSFEAFHYTESNEFCGTLCHKVMSPEYTTYHRSEHAKVKCVECHVGSGAKWYVKSKLSGLYQVYAALTDKYPVPIATPVHSLRPAKETCEECHWPQKFYGRKMISKKYYLSDEENSEWDITLLMKTGPEKEFLGQKNGIHWHIRPDVRIEYVSATFQRDTIVFVKYTNLTTGKVVTYKDTSNFFTDNQIDTLEHRVMDCIDCHNRPSHKFVSPINFFDNELNKGSIPKNLPDIKMITMDVLYNNTFPTYDSANRFINSQLNEYYELMYPEIYDTGKVLIENVIRNIQKAYKENVFPYMQAQWDQHPNFIEHLESNGCLRCHNGNFINDKGEAISRDCDVCHEIKAQGVPGQIEFAKVNESLEFKHPTGIKGKWKKITCYECHKNLYE